MTITDKNLSIERAHVNDIGGVQRLYSLPNGYGLSLVNSPVLHSYRFAWEAAVLKGFNPNKNTWDHLTYDTPLTENVEVFSTDEEANAFIEKAIAWAKSDASEKK